MTYLAALAASWPLLRPKARRREPSDAAFYRAQLAEIERDVERGQLPATEAPVARAEVARRLIAVGDDDKSRSVDPRLRRAAAIAIIVLIPSRCRRRLRRSRAPRPTRRPAFFATGGRRRPRLGRVRRRPCRGGNYGFAG